MNILSREKLETYYNYGINIVKIFKLFIDKECWNIFAENIYNISSNKIFEMSCFLCICNFCPIEEKSSKGCSKQKETVNKLYSTYRISKMFSYYYLEERKTIYE